MSTTISRQPSKIRPDRLERLEKLLRGVSVNPSPDILLDHIFSYYGFHRRRNESATYNAWKIDNPGILHLYRHSQRNYRQTFVLHLTHTTRQKKRISRTRDQGYFVYAPQSDTSRQGTELTKDPSFDNSSRNSSVSKGSQADAKEVKVMESVVDLAKDIQGHTVQSEAIKSRLREIAEQMINEIIENSEERLQGFLAVIEREQTILSEHRSQTASSLTSNVLSGLGSRLDNPLDDAAIQSLAANFLDDLTDSVVMHLEDILDEQLMQVTGVTEEKEESSSESTNDF
ncbi:hypothetical protein D915_004186 [Fasciola hepatica]|uniref:Uncharacterized protein n=1 Tax=Fasciola hepatica TaxID=6192 RepID=A0A4E0RED3_FASHE|nr:hypothetical protein D915_004186 [Fasciola hepatica]